MEKQYTQDELAAIQIQKEISMKTAGVERFNMNNERAIKSGAASETDWNRRILQELVEPMSDSIDIYLDYYKGRRGKPAKSLTFLKALPSTQAAYITIKNVLDGLTRETEITGIAKTIGLRIEDQVRFANIAKTAPKYIDKVKKRLRQNNSMQYKHRKTVFDTAEKSLVAGNAEREIDAKPELKWQPWNEQDICQLGSHLINIFADNVLFNGKPIIYKKSVINGKKNKTFLAPTEYMESWIDEYKGIMEVLAPAFAPCVIPPRDWESCTIGGYHVPEIAETLPLVKCRASQKKRLTYKQMPEVYDATNALQNVSWQINERVYDIVKQVIRLGLPYGIPSREPLQMPDSPLGEEYEGVKGKQLKEMMTEKEWSDFIFWKREITKLHTQEQKRKSNYLRVIRIMGSISQYKDFKKLYFVYTMDFRGRVYCCSDTASPQGSDLQKGLINFSNGEALGDDGMFWLAVHGANVYGNDKCTFEDRVKFIEGMEDTIRDIAADPLTFTDWVTVDKPYQFLAWCFEWADLLDYIEAGNNAKDFISHTVVAMDGSCSGIQHYSAILRDPIGGRAVNLVPDTKPHDIYDNVAQVAIRKFKEIINSPDKTDENGKFLHLPEIAQGWLDIKGGFSRKITKSPTMTITYSSTRIRCLDTTADYLTKLQLDENVEAKLQNRKPIKVHPFAENKNDTGQPRFQAEKLAANVIWDSIAEVVIAAKTCMKYIQDVTKEVVKANRHLEILTPTGFIVEQRKMNQTNRRVKTQLLGETFITLKDDKTTLNIRKMRSSSAPNFIHSMDASHLIKTVNALKAQGIKDIAVIHDSFGTHACNVNTLKTILTKTFVDMYQQNDVLADFKKHNEDTHFIKIETEVPKAFDLDLNVIKDSKYCFG